MNEQEQLRELNKWIELFYAEKKFNMKNPLLRVLFLEVTLRCNARCEHCGSSCGDRILKDEITADEIKNVLKSIADNPNYNQNNIILAVTGGEPLVRKDLFDILEYATSLGFPYGITTNGFLITQDIVDKMVKTGMYSISISVDGLEKTHEDFRKVPGGYKKLMEGLQILINTPQIPRVQVTTCVNKKNIHELEEMYKMFVKMGLKEWRIVEVDSIGRAKKNDEILMGRNEFVKMLKFIEAKQKNQDGIKVTYGGCGHFLGREYEEKLRETPAYCGAGVSVASILSNGDIFVCPDVEHRPELIQGNIRKDDFIDVWEHKFKPYRNIKRTCNEKCKKCKDWKLCTGDGFHTWNFDESKPSFCCKELVENEDVKFFNE